MNMNLFSLAPGRLPVLPSLGFGLVKLPFCVQCSSKPMIQLSSSSDVTKKLGKSVKKSRKREHHLWKRKESAGSGQKAMNLVRIVSRLPNEKEAIYSALDEWIAWELEFPMLAVAKALQILKNQRQWARIIQVVKWMLSKGQGKTMTTYDTVLLAFDMEMRIDEAGSLWNMILHTHTRSISKRLFSRMISLYDHHNMPQKVIELILMWTVPNWSIENPLQNDPAKTRWPCFYTMVPTPFKVFADMEELGVKPDEDTVRRIARTFERLGQEDKKNLVINRYGCKWKYVHFKGERVKVRRDLLVDSKLN